MRTTKTQSASKGLEEKNIWCSLGINFLFRDCSGLVTFAVAWCRANKSWCRMTLIGDVMKIGCTVPRSNPFLELFQSRRDSRGSYQFHECCWSLRRISEIQGLYLPRPNQSQ